MVKWENGVITIRQDCWKCQDGNDIFSADQLYEPSPHT
jgi:hypothetical protein